jgi:ribosomal protein L11 methylase PrmA
LAQKVSNNGYLIISGFLDFDLNEMRTAAEQLGFKEIETIAENAWQGICLQKT